MEWFRFWNKTLNCPKVQRLPGETFKAWVNLMSIVSETDSGGLLPDRETIAFSLRISADHLSVHIDKLLGARLLDQDPITNQLSIHDWDHWQPSWDNGARRQKRYRERKKKVNKQTALRNGDVTLRNALHKSDAPDSDTDTDTDSDKDKERLLSSSSPLPPEGGATTTTEECPEYPEENGMFMIMPGEHEHPEIEARQIWGMIWKAWKKKKLCYEFYEHQRWLSLRAWKWAMASAISKGQTPGTIKYLETIGHEGEAKGFKKAAPAKRGDIGNVPYRPTSATDDEPKGKIFGAIRGP